MLSADQLTRLVRQLSQARARLMSGSAQLLAVRCRADRICPPEKIERLKQEFPRGLQVIQYAETTDRNALGERPRATYTREYRVAPPGEKDHFARRAFDDLLQFLARNSSLEHDSPMV